MLRLSPWYRIALVALIAVIGLSVLGWRCGTAPALRFLPARDSAEWIVYPNPRDLHSHAVVDSSAVFRRDLLLETEPAESRLTYCAFRDGAGVSVNGHEIPSAASPSHNWKQAVEIDLTGTLHTGRNQIAITVTNDNAPPALWAVVRSGSSQVASDDLWDVSWAGAAWRPARLADEPMPAGPGNVLLGGEQPLPSLGLVWPTLIGMVGLVAGVMFILKRGFQTRPTAVPTLALGLYVLMWVALFANNLRSLPRVAGFDGNEHLEYIQYLLSHGHLPLATEGQQMYQPPGYYAVSAGLLALLGLTLDDQGVLILRLLGLGIAIVHLVLLYQALRLVFPDDTKKQLAGLTLAAFLPANLYVCHFITNEGLAATLVTASLLLSLGLVREPVPDGKKCAGLGICLGMALLTKLTAALTVPIVFGAILIHATRQSAELRRRWLWQIAAAGGLCLLLGGWHYARLWGRYGSPLVANWDPRLGSAWWQAPGFHTASYYLRFSAALHDPWFGGFESLADGIYATLWGDGFLSGASQLQFRLPWNYGLMAAGFLLALVPTVLLLAGAFAATMRLMRTFRIELMILAGYAAAALAALLWLSLQVPHVSVVKSSYLLSALLPLAVFGALGWEALTRRSLATRGLAGMALGVWALASFCSFWVRAGSPAVERVKGLDLYKQKRYGEALDCFSRAVRADPADLAARTMLATLLSAVGQNQEALALSTATVREFPQDVAAHTDLATALGAANRSDGAIAEARRAVELGPDYARAHAVLTTLLEQASKPDEMVPACREALRVSPLDPTLHARLGLGLAAQAQSERSPGAALQSEASEQLSLAIAIDPTATEVRKNLGAVLEAQGKPAEAIVQYREVLQRIPADVDTLNRWAWVLATVPQQSVRDGGNAVKLATQANQLSGGHDPVVLRTLAAAWAEVGKFSEAEQTARSAWQIAESQSNASLADMLHQEITRYSAGKRFEQVR